MSAETPIPPPRPEQLVVAIHTLQAQVTCALAALGVLAEAAPTEIIQLAAGAVRASAKTVPSLIYPGREEEFGLTDAANHIANKVAELLESSLPTHVPHASS